MTLQRQIEQLVSQQASQWIEVLRSGGKKEHAAFVAWLKESRRHVSEFLAMVAVDRELQGVDRERRQDLEELLRRISPPVSQLQKHAPTPALRRFEGERVRQVAIAAGIGVLAAVGAWFFYAGPGSWQNYTTDIGEQRAIELGDGSLVYLNTQSRMQVRLEKASREIRLVSGEALFKVAHESARPFRVRARDTLVQAVGTQFNVRAAGDETTVAVIEGKVRVSIANEAAALVAGEQAHIGVGGKIQRNALQDAQSITSWRERRLVFREDTLENMIAEFNRYNLKPRFRLEGDAVKLRHYSGTFDADDPESLAALLSRERGISVERTGDEIVVR